MNICELRCLIVLQMALMVKTARISNLLQNLPVKCSRVQRLQSDSIDWLIDNNGTLSASFTKTLQFSIDIHESICLLLIDQHNQSINNVVNDNVMVLVIQYARMTHQYAIRQQYQFGMPQLQSKCSCYCDRRVTCTDKCSKGDSETSTGRGPCVTSEHFGAPCTRDTGIDSRICCAIVMTNYRDWLFNAVNIGGVSLFAELTYRVYSKHTIDNTDEWLSHGQRFTLPLTQQQSVNDSQGLFTMTAELTGYLQRVTPGMYFTFANESRLRTGVTLNEKYEHDMDKLGWLRYSHPYWHWDTRTTLAVQRAHAVTDIDCQQQLFEETYLASQFVLETIDNDLEQRFYLGDDLSDWELWMGESYLQPSAGTLRHFIVNSKRGRLALSVSVSDLLLPQQIHHESTILDFTAKIVLDINSNRFLNLTLIGADGTFMGSCKDERDSESVVSFKVSVPDNPEPQIYLVSIPFHISSQREICLSDTAGTELCRVANFYSEQLSKVLMASDYVEQKGDCKDCAPISKSIFETLEDLFNPAEWLDGINSIEDLLFFVLQVVLYILFLLLFIVCARRVLLPLCKCAVSTNSSSRHRQQQTALVQVEIVNKTNEKENMEDV